VSWGYGYALDKFHGFYSRISYACRYYKRRYNLATLQYDLYGDTINDTLLCSTLSRDTTADYLWYFTLSGDATGDYSIYRLFALI
jgi:hypothetical protein